MIRCVKVVFIFVAHSEIYETKLVVCDAGASGSRCRRLGSAGQYGGAGASPAAGPLTITGTAARRRNFWTALLFSAAGR